MRTWPARLLASVILLVSARAAAGPPYDTDDPEPVELHHWEVYLATHQSLTRGELAGTAPHLELNYGAQPGLQLHLLVPVVVDRPSGGPARFGVGDLELGAKLRFLEEGRWRPMIGTFPFLEVPVGAAVDGVRTGQPRLFLPLWLQKSVGRLTTYGGAGYWINPGTGNRNWWFVGWQAQVKVTRFLAPGAEVYYVTADRAGGRGDLRFNVGFVLDLGEHHHVLASAGRSLVGDTRLQGYFAYLLTL
jgi:hypothetical protein